MKSDPGATFASGSFSFAVSRRLFFLRKVLNRQGKLVGSERDFSKISFFQKELFSLHLEIPCQNVHFQTFDSETFLKFMYHERR
jgi:hypothetical protein